LQGSSLSAGNNTDDKIVTNFETDTSSAEFARYVRKARYIFTWLTITYMSQPRLYKESNMPGGHVIMLGIFVFSTKRIGIDWTAL
jgi:hypothetical protein